MSIVLSPGNAPSFWFMGIQATVLSRGGDSAPTTMELILPPGGSTPLHLHEDDEDSGVVVEGALAAWCDGAIHPAPVGSWLSLPRGRPHALLCTSAAPSRVIAVYSNSHFADFVAAVGVPADQPRPQPGPPPASELPRLRDIAARHHLSILGAPPPELLALRT